MAWVFVKFYPQQLQRNAGQSRGYIYIYIYYNVCVEWISEKSSCQEQSSLKEEKLKGILEDFLVWDLLLIQ